jgi:hypothetical protein
MIEVYLQNKNYKTKLKCISELSILDNQVAAYVATIKKKDNTEYKALSVCQAVDGINCYFCHQFLNLLKVLDRKMKELQDKGFGKIKESQL